MCDDLDFEMEVVQIGELDSSDSAEDVSDKNMGYDSKSTAQTYVNGDEEGNELSSRFDDLPDNWVVKQIDEVAKVVGGSTPSTSNDSYWDGDIPWATPTDVTGLQKTTISNTEKSITKEGLNSASTHVLPAYSVLMTSRATIGACAVNTVPMATNQGFQSLVPGEGLNTWYLFYRMLREAPYLESLGAGSTFSEVSKRVVEKVDIPIPPLPEQRKIASVFYTIDELLALSHSDELRDLKTGLMQDLLSGDVRTNNKEIDVLEEVIARG